MLVDGALVLTFVVGGVAALGILVDCGREEAGAIVVGVGADGGVSPKGLGDLEAEGALPAGLGLGCLDLVVGFGSGELVLGVEDLGVKYAAESERAGVCDCCCC